MSRIGNRVLTIPNGVTLTVEDNKITVKGPKGEPSTEIDRRITVEVNNEEVVIKRENDNYKNLHGTVNANLKNMITGVS